MSQPLPPLCQQPETRSILYVLLADGVQARLDLQIIREPILPSPSEPVRHSAPSHRELALVAGKLAANQFRLHPYV